ncbi:MAG TPA: hypothetical protein DD611_03610 [Alphaproteobacteria bacterium]|nr:hypothetical protein [Alphaproteobacteria bacterium]
MYCYKKRTQKSASVVKTDGRTRFIKIFSNLTFSFLSVLDRFTRLGHRIITKFFINVKNKFARYKIKVLCKKKIIKNYNYFLVITFTK